MRGATSVIFQHHEILRLPRKMTLMIDPRHIWNVIYNKRNNKCHPPTSRNIAPAKKITLVNHPRHIWNVIYNARSNRGYHPTSPNTAPATKNDSHDWSSSHLKRQLQCAEQQRSPENINKYCACHEEWLSRLILVTYETLFTMRGATNVILQHHRILRLPRKMTLQNFHRNFSETHETSFTMRDQSDHDPRPIREWNRHTATRLATEVTFRAHHEHFLLKNTTFHAPAIIPNFTQCCTCHEKWHLNFTKYCACHEKWHLNVIKYCTPYDSLLYATLPYSSLLFATLLDSNLFSDESILRRIYSQANLISNESILRRI